MKVNLAILTLVLFAFFDPARCGIIRSNGQPNSKIMAPNMNFQNPLIPTQKNGMSATPNPFNMQMTGYPAMGQQNFPNMQQSVQLTPMNNR